MEINEIVKERIEKLDNEELEKLADYAGYLIYHRELREDQLLAEKIKENLDDEYLTVDEAKEFMKNA